ncbi:MULTISPECIES: hypothetical protein [unclassified Pseudomonas]|uniref:hypothetical protein n=1 Tax=unclassified Pseudomonas TaxID=196821 RepID=UPI00257E3E22|nr:MULTISPECIES: hypothetical protein [unclassified Pseudomonas]
MAYNTHNPIPSSDPRDLFDNTTTIDLIINSGADRVPGRFGQMLYTWGFFHRLVETAVVQIDGVIANATSQVNARRDSGIAEINQSVAAVDAAEAAAKAEMEETAANLGNDLNNKSYAKYSEMLADPQTRDSVVGIVDGDEDPNLDGWYRWSSASQRWQRIEQQPLVTAEGFSEKTLFSLLDSNRLETWLGVNSVDGGPSEHAERLLRLMFGIFSQGRTGYLAALADANGLMTDLAIRDTDGQFDDFVMERWAPRINQRILDKVEIEGRTGYLFGIADANRVMTDLCVDDVTGQFPPFVVERLAPRIARYLPQPSGDSAWLLNDQYVDDEGKVRRVFANPLSWSGWGSSTIDEWVELGAIAGQFGATYYNGGNGATELQHNLAQMGARPALLLPQGGEIPASGSLVVACSNVIPVAAFKATAGTLAGVSGTLTSSATEWTFTRSAPGSAVAVAVETPFIPTNGLFHRGDTWAMNEGKNDINNGRPMEQTMAWHQLAYNWNSALNKRVIVMTHFGHTGNQSPSHTAKCKQLNDFIHATYGDHVFDLAAYLCSAEVWEDTGLTPTAADLQNQAAGCLPASLSRDNLAHMNAKARAAAANKLKSQLINMGWFKE